jgi:transcriptional regulator with XRE-family HTH domain
MNLQLWMKATGYTDARLSAEVGVSRVQISRIRRGICKASPETAMKLEQVTKIPAPRFIFDDAA